MSNYETYDETTPLPAFPDLFAIDPRGCGCTECLVRTYVPEEDFLLDANKGDMLRLMRGEIRFNYSGETVTSFMFSNSFETESARDFISEIQAFAVENFPA